jgi:hypothetical protein
MLVAVEVVVIQVPMQLVGLVAAVKVQHPIVQMLVLVLLTLVAAVAVEAVVLRVVVELADQA